MWNNLVYAYYRYRRGYIGLLLAFLLIFSAVFSLYDLPTEAVLYAGLLCLCLGLLIAVLDYHNFAKKHKQLCELSKSIILSVDGLVQASNLIEQDYQNLIRAVHEEKIKLVSHMDLRFSARMDYYTTWVHQIKTPIAAMQLLLQTEENEQSAELLQELFRIEQYVEMVLQYLRLDSDSTDFMIQKYDLDQLLKQAIRKYAKQFIRKKILLDYQEVKTVILSDEKWLSFVIEQVLSNALKYTNAGKISIFMVAEETLVITDSGIGIQAEDLPRVFEKGFTGYNGRSDRKSTGIGLYLCKQICAKLGHSIQIESAAGKGTQVKICLHSVDLKVE